MGFRNERMKECYALKGAEKATKTDESTSEHGSWLILPVSKHESKHRCPLFALPEWPGGLITTLSTFPKPPSVSESSESETQRGLVENWYGPIDFVFLDLDMAWGCSTSNEHHCGVRHAVQNHLCYQLTAIIFLMLFRGSKHCRWAINFNCLLPFQYGTKHCLWCCCAKNGALII